MVRIHAGYAGMAAMVLLVSASHLSGCTRQEETRPSAGAMRQMKTIDDVIKEHADSLMAIPGVVGVYHGETDSGKTCLKVMVRQVTPDLRKRIPEQLEGYPVLLDETGEITPLGG